MYRLRNLPDRIQRLAASLNPGASQLSGASLYPADQGRLFISYPGMRTRHIRLDKQLLTIGRSRRNDIILNDNNIAPQHARLRQTSEGWQVEDLASPSGTFLSGRVLLPNSPVKWLPNRPLQIAAYTLRWSQPTDGATVPIFRVSQASDSRLVALSRAWPRLGILLIVIWLLVLLRLPLLLPSLLASCLTFTALLITPGYLLTDMIAWRLGLDKVEQLALALPLGITVLALPGMTALLLHLTLISLALGWFTISAAVIALWLLARSGVSPLDRLFGDRSALPPRPSVPWAIDELILLFFLVALFVLILPTLSLPKIDGDAYAVSTFAVDALAGLPLNAREPLFGTDLGPTVRMVFNQYLPLSYLWSYLAGLDSIALISRFSRQILALWAVLAMYMLGKAAGTESRRFGLMTAIIQLLIYAAAPFWRDDNASFYFFERINADKFMVMVLLLPPCFALAIRFVRHGHPDAWFAAVLVAFATSTIHPLAAAMLALALVAFGGCHWLLNLREQLAWLRSMGLVALAAVVMLLPIVQLILARGEAPLAPAYPDSFEGWSVGEKAVPILPFVHIRGLDLYGPLPQLDQLQASQANSSTNPFLIWRFGVNMDRQRLIVFDPHHFISDPRLLLEPPYLLALLLLPLLMGRIRTDPAVQFVTGTTLAILFVMFNPFVTPLIGSLVMPWILWRFIWLFPYVLIIALAAQQVFAPKAPFPRPGSQRELAPRLGFRVTTPGWAQRTQGHHRLLAAMLIVGLLASPAIVSQIRYLKYDSSSFYFYPAPQRIFDHLNAVTGPHKQAMVLADQDLSVTIAAYVAGANILAHRVPTTSEIFPADQQDAALQRLIDQDAFFRTPYLTADSANILSRYGIDYVITSSGSDLDLQLQLAPEWFRWQLDDQSYSLYAVIDVPLATAVAIQGNNALAQRDWATAESLYEAALAQNPGDLLALAGLAEIAQQQGQFDEALAWWRSALAQADLPILHARVGQLYAERSDFLRSGTEWEQASRAAPEVARYRIGLGDACLHSGLESCAAEQYAAAAARRNLPDQAARLLMEANLWQQQGRFDRALSLYEQAVALQPTQFNQYILESAYRESGYPEKSEALLQRLRSQDPFSAELAIVTANLLTQTNHIDEAAGFYRRAIWLEQLQAQDTVDTRLRLAQLLLNAGQLVKAGKVIDKTLSLAPYNPDAYRLQGDLFRRTGEFDRASDSYGLALMLEPTRVSTYTSLNYEFRQHDGRPVDWLRILQAAVAANPHEPSLYVALGDQLQRQGEHEAAIAAYLSALENLDPDVSSGEFLRPANRQGRAFIYSRLARIYEDQGKTTAALNYYRAMAAAAPDAPWTQIMLGDAWRRQKDMDTAETLYQQVLENDPTYLIAYLRLAEISDARGNGDEAATFRGQAKQLAESQLVNLLQNVQPSKIGERSSLLSLPIFSDQAAPSESAATENGENFIQYLQSAEEQITTLGVLTHLYQLSGQTDKAIQLYQSSLAHSQQNGGSPESQAQYHKGLGDLHLAQGELAPAIDAYRQALRLDQWWSEARLGLATALIAQGNGDESVAQLQTAVELAPGVMEVRLALANTLWQQGRLDEARSIYEAAVYDFPGSIQVKQGLAEFYETHRQPREALVLYEQALALDPTDTTLYQALSRVWLTQGDASQAQAVLESGLNRVSDPTELTAALSTLFLQQNKPEDALAILRQGISRVGQNTPLLLALGNYYASRANYEQAAESYQHALSADPGSAAVHMALADLAMHRDDVGNALDHYKQAMNLAPTAPGYRLALASAYHTNKDYEQAATAYSEALALEPDLTAAYIGLAEVFQAQRQPDQALRTFEQGLAVTPKSAWLLSAYASFLLSRGDETRALDLIQQATENVQDVPALVAIAAFYDTVGREESSEALLQIALAQEPGSILALLGLGDLYEGQGRTDDAQRVYEQVVTLTPGLSTGYLRLGNLANEAGDQVAADRYAALAQQVAPASFGP